MFDKKLMRMTGIAAGLVASTLAVVGLSSREAEAGDPRVCFYEHVNYQGRMMCVNMGYQQNDLTRVTEADGFNWNDKISSIKLHNHARAVVYEHVNFQGRSWTIRFDAPDLTAVSWTGGPININDIISSMKVN